ncbi:type IV conjugative transfer system coupling protein TraD [Vibrio mediterranei]|uniref:Conjugative coupling factor TraD, PFGI-1 class n=1 Tax=Vibrio mediterranei TaxID=689 RepID=A0ABX5D697_9VIBR|nr:type IV conjugative transfer system coupling protein TraD [Vibrio mediterranei]PCD85315.1 conjugative coupling factor TraD, PFGI-1 class [Vibrio mediterranei]PRQ64538.1 conjugative coupling factor TraD, PFGI-1 class [Vibrio mediterranei]
MSGVTEGLLRPAEELLSAWMFGLACAVVMVRPELFLLPSMLQTGTAVCLFVCMLIRLKQGLDILAYRQGLLKLPYWEMASVDMPVYKSKLFLGKGFLVLPRHAQRLYDARQVSAERFVTPSKGYVAARRWEAKYEGTWIERFWSGKTVIKRAGVWYGLLNVTLKAVNPFKPLPPVGGDSRLHGVGLEEETDCLLPMSARAGHTLVLGTTGVGKTRLAELLVTQDIRRGDVVLVFDPKGDADMLMRMYIECLRAGRLDEFYVLHLGYPDQSGRYSPVGRFGRITEVATRVSGQLDGGGNSAAFKQFAWRFVNIIARALDALGKKPDMAAIQRYVTAIDELYVSYCLKKLPSYHPKAAELVAALESNVTDKNTPRHLQGRSPRVVALEMYFGQYPPSDDVLAGIRSAIQYDKTYFDKIVASLLPLLEKLGTGKTAEIISPVHSPSDERPVLDWREVIMRGGVVYVGLDALSDTTVAAAFGNSMFADLCSLAGEIYKFGNAPGFGKTQPRQIMIHADEFNELIGDEFIPILNKARGAKFVVTAYTQTESDIEARLGSPSKAAQTKGNFNSLVCLRVRELKTAQFMTSSMPPVTIKDIVPDTGVSDAPGSATGFRSTNKDSLQSKEVPLVSETDITNLPIGQAYAELEGSKVWKLRFPLPSNKGDEHLPDNIQTLVDHMMEKTQSTKDTNQWLQDSEQFNRYIESAYYELEEETSEV